MDWGNSVLPYSWDRLSSFFGENLIEEREIVEAREIGFLAAEKSIVEGLLGYSHEDLRTGFADGTFWPVSRARFPYLEEMLR